jgi:thiamine-phosphate pyrophosphorylase
MHPSLFGPWPRDGRPHLLLLTDDRPGRDWLAAIRRLPPGSGVIVRARINVELQVLAAKLHQPCAERRLQLLIAGLDHIPEARLRQGKVRRRPGPRWLTGSAHGVPGLVAARRAKLDAVLLSPWFPTRSHPGARGLGITRAGLLLRQAKVPVLALGGITPTKSLALRTRRLAGIAAIDGWFA